RSWSELHQGRVGIVLEDFVATQRHPGMDWLFVETPWNSNALQDFQVDEISLVKISDAPAGPGFTSLEKVQTKPIGDHNPLVGHKFGADPHHLIYNGRLYIYSTNDTRAEGRVFARNEFFKYSNIAYGLLGLVVEAASGVDYDEFTRAHICAPLGLERSGSEWQAAREAEYAAGHTARLADGERRVIGHVDTRALAAATGWFSTAAETTAYLSAHRLGDERLVSDDAKRQAQHPHSRIDIGGALRDYGLGFELHTLGGRRLVGHSGGYPGHITRTWLDPDEGVSVSVFTNAIDGPADLLATGAMALIHLALSHADDEERAELPEERFASLWSVLDIAHLGGATFALHPVADDPARGAERVEIAADGTLHQSRRDGFGATGEPVEVARAADGAVESISWSGMTMWPHAVFTEAMALPDPGAVLERMSL
ncbi:serine hydrolase, partial [Microbacterium sp. B24]|uniref:serine hydrolase n=1 Tax=Microbacterium sp. B24 TaxID=95616 RepID=UPI001EF9D28C